MSGEISTSRESEIFGRVCKLLVVDKKNNAVDLSELRIKFHVKRSDTMTPNIADIVVYNLSDETALKLSNTKEFNRIILQAGYEGNFGIIFQGNIKQVIKGRESATDTFINFIAGDGDRGYNFAIVNATLAAGSSQNDHMQAALNSMLAMGVGKGYVGDLPSTKLPRGKVMYGEAKGVLRTLAQTTNQSWSIQDEAITFIPKKAYLPGERVVLTSKTGMIGTPQQTNEGVSCKSFLNPLYKIGGRIQIDNKSIERLKINLSVPLKPENIPAPLTADGVYYILVAEHEGDTRGPAWYSSLTCLNIDVTTNPLNSVQVGYNGQVS